MILKLRRQGTDELIRLPQLLREINRKISQHGDLDFGMLECQLIERAGGQGPGMDAGISVNRCASRRLAEHDHFAEAHAGRQGRDALMRAADPAAGAPGYPSGAP